MSSLKTFNTFPSLYKTWGITFNNFNINSKINSNKIITSSINSPQLTPPISTLSQKTPFSKTSSVSSPLPNNFSHNHKHFCLSNKIPHPLNPNLLPTNPLPIIPPGLPTTFNSKCSKPYNKSTHGFMKSLRMSNSMGKRRGRGSWLWLSKKTLNLAIWAKKCRKSPISLPWRLSKMINSDKALINSLHRASSRQCSRTLPVPMLINPSLQIVEAWTTCKTPTITTNVPKTHLPVAHQKTNPLVDPCPANKTGHHSLITSPVNPQPDNNPATPYPITSITTKTLLKTICHPHAVMNKRRPTKSYLSVKSTKATMDLTSAFSRQSASLTYLCIVLNFSKTTASPNLPGRKAISLQVIKVANDNSWKQENTWKSSNIICNRRWKSISTSWETPLQGLDLTLTLMPLPNTSDWRWLNRRKRNAESKKRGRRKDSTLAGTKRVTAQTLIFPKTPTCKTPPPRCKTCSTSKNNTTTHTTTLSHQNKAWTK